MSGIHIGRIHGGNVMKLQKYCFTGLQARGDLLRQPVRLLVVALGASRHHNQHKNFRKKNPEAGTHHRVRAPS
jgi:hypothetical protein